MNKKQRIAVIGLKGLPAFGGAAAVGENIIKKLQFEYDFTVYASSAYTTQKTGDYNGLCKQIVFKLKKNTKYSNTWYYIVSIFHAFLFGKYDLIHLHHRAAVVFLPLLRLRFPVIVTTHGMIAEERYKSLDKLLAFSNKFCLSAASLITTVSKKDFDIVCKYVKRNKVTYIPNGVDQYSASSHHYGVNKNYFAFAAGRILRTKGCHTLLMALKSINWPLKTIIIGDLNYDKGYKSELEDLAKGGNVEFHGLITDKPCFTKHIKSAKLFIYPSYVESMSMVLLEAASLKTPIICCDIRENRDIFNEDHVLFHRAQDPESLSEKILWALENYDVMKNKAESAYNHLVNQQSWDAVSEMYSKVFNKCLKV